MTLSSKATSADLPLVSIIVPIYGVDSYVERCVTSLIKQSYTNIEIVLVDDGSDDESGQIIDELSRADERIVTVHKQNQGVSAARNDGLKWASGDYIMFVDGDDYVDTDYVEYFLSMATTHSCVMAVGTEFYYSEDLERADDTDSVVTSEEITERIYLGTIGVAVWNKIYKKEWLDKQGIRFCDDFWFAEGMLFNIQCLQCTGQVASGNRRVYHAVENPNSATRSFNLSSWLCGLRSMEYQRDTWISVTPDIQMAWEYHYRKYAESILSGLIETDSLDEHREIASACIHQLRTHLRIPLQANISYSAMDRAICMAINPLLWFKRRGGTFECDPSYDILSHIYIKIYSTIPFRIKKHVLALLHDYYRSHYKPHYLDRTLL